MIFLYSDDGMSGLEISGLVALVFIIVLLLAVASALVARFRFGVCKGEEEEGKSLLDLHIFSFNYIVFN